MAKVRYTLTRQKCPVTGAALATMPVEVKGKIFTATKRIFSNVEELGGLADDDLLKMVNYAEDLFVRAKCTSDNTDATGKAAKRLEAREHWKLNDKTGFMALVLRDGITDKELNAAFDAYYEEHLAE